MSWTHGSFFLFFNPNLKLTMAYWTFAVVNLTLIDLPGLTKVAVGKKQKGHVFLVPVGFVKFLLWRLWRVRC